jgi:hypothetical protein
VRDGRDVDGAAGLTERILQHGHQPLLVTLDRDPHALAGGVGDLEAGIMARRLDRTRAEDFRHTTDRAVHAYCCM